MTEPDPPASPSLLDLRRGSTLSSLVAKEISRLILTEEFPRGSRLNEAELATRFGISRGPVREALRTIERDGLVVGIANRGVFVREIDSSAAAEIYDVRAALFSMAGWILAPIISDDDLARLADLLAQMDVAQNAEDLEAYYPINLEFHATLVRLAGNARLTEAYFGLIQELHLFRRRSLVSPGGMMRSNIEHGAILDALRQHDPELTASRMRAHVLVSRDRMLAEPDPKRP
ncbi:MAG: FCD domain-containing protein [Acetobacteraceae bacterium]